MQEEITFLSHTFICINPKKYLNFVKQAFGPIHVLNI